MPEPIIKSPTEVRSATKDGVFRYVLAISLGLVLVLSAIGYVVVHHLV